MTGGSYNLPPVGRPPHTQTSETIPMNTFAQTSVSLQAPAEKSNPRDSWPAWTDSARYNIGPAPSTSSHLTAPEREVLVGLIAKHPLLSCPQIATIFAFQTGRSISKVAVRRVWVRGYKSSAVAESVVG